MIPGPIPNSLYDIAGIDIYCRGMHEHRWDGFFWRCARCGRTVDPWRAEHEAARHAVALALLWWVP